MNPEPTLERLLDRTGHRVGLVFADIVGSTLLLHNRGTEVYARILSAYRSRADTLALDQQGVVVSHEGDEVFAVFPSAATAYMYARGLFDDAGHPLLTARIGMHFGPVRRHESGLIGRVVPLAARVMAHAAPHQIWVSDAAKKALEAESSPLAEGIRWITSEQCLFDGVPDPQRLWRAA
jgi:class 3 adenylate cyclase